MMGRVLIRTDFPSCKTEDVLFLNGSVVKSKPVSRVKHLHVTLEAVYCSDETISGAPLNACTRFQVSIAVERVWEAIVPHVRAFLREHPSIWNPTCRK